MDIVCLVTDHDYINYDVIRSFSKIIVDCRGKFKKTKKLLELNEYFSYWSCRFYWFSYFKYFM